MELNLNKMKAIHYIILCATILISYSCTKEIIENHAPSIAGTEETFLAYNADDASTKTVLKKDGSINWLSSDKINLFYGKDYSTTFECKSTTPDENGFATFHGSLKGCEENNESFFFAVYPYSAGNSFDGAEATITLPSEQIAVANTFADDLFISVAQTKDRTLSFYNVCGGVKFSVARNGVTQIKFRV